MLKTQALHDLHLGADYVLKHTHIESGAKNSQKVIGWCGPARSGTTALLFLLACHPQVDRAYFQPQRTLMRLGGPDFNLYASDKIVCMKETFWSLETEEPYDPVEMLIKAGVPKENITWVVMLRDPLQVFASWEFFDPGINPEMLALWQSYSVQLFYKYKKMGINVIPFVYELLEHHEVEIVCKLLNKVGLDDKDFKMNFDYNQMAHKVILGQAADQEYFGKLIKGTLERREFIYNRNNYAISDNDRKMVTELCMPEYLSFYESAKQAFSVKK